MATTITIMGGCILKTATKGTATAATTTVGQSPDNPAISFDEIVSKKWVHTSQSGPDLPAASYTIGRRARLAIPLIDYDEAQVNTLRQNVGASAAGQLGTLGGATPQFQLTIAPRNSGVTGYIFPYCEFVDTIKIEGFGVTEKITTLVVDCLPDMTQLNTATNSYYLTFTSSGYSS